MEKVKKSLVKKEYLIPFILVTSLFFLWGFAHAILDVLNKHFQEALDKSSLRLDPGNDVHRLFYDGDPCRTFYQ